MMMYHDLVSSIFIYFVTVFGQQAGGVSSQRAFSALNFLAFGAFMM